MDCDKIIESYHEYLNIYVQCNHVKILNQCPICNRHYKFSANGKIFGCSFYSYMHHMQVCAKCKLDDYVFVKKVDVFFIGA